MSEIWKQAVGFEGYYEVSSLGRVRSLDRIANSRSPRLVKGRTLKTPCNSDGYPTVKPHIKGRGTSEKVHRMVAKAFLENTGDKEQVNHIDGDKSNNAINNLEWCSARENVRHARDTGLREKAIFTGEENRASILNEHEVIRIRQLQNILTQGELQKLFGVSRSTIQNVLSRRTWKHI